MTPENRPHPQAPITKEVNPGIVPVTEGGERALENAPSVQDITNTDEIPALVPQHSGELILTDDERRSEKFQRLTDYYAEQRVITEATATETTSPLAGGEALTASTTETSTWSPNDSEAAKETAERKKKKKRNLLITIGASATAAALALTTYFSTQSGDKGEDGPAPTQPVATAEATPGQTQEAPGSKVDVTKRPQSIVEQGLFKELSPEQQTEIRKLDAMTTTEFYELPMATQLKYAQFIYDSNVERTKYLIEQNGSEYAPLLKTVEPKPDNSGTEVWYQQQLVTEVLYTLMPDQKPLDKVNAQKLMVLNVTQDTAGFMKTFNTIETDKGGLLKPDNNPILAYRTDVQGSEATMKINANVDNKLSQTTHEYIAFTDINGDERGAWQVTLSVSSSDPRFDSSIK